MLDCNSISWMAAVHTYIQLFNGFFPGHMDGCYNGKIFFLKGGWFWMKVG